MALRDRLAARVEPLLEPGERVQEVLLAQSGASPYWFALASLGVVVAMRGFEQLLVSLAALAVVAALVVMFALVAYDLTRRRIIVVTDRAIVMFRAGGWIVVTSPKEVVARLPRSTRIGPLSGLWAKTEIGDERLWIHLRFHGDAARADAAAPGPSGTGAPLPPAPGA